MSFLRKYSYIFKSTWEENLAYRSNFFLEILGGVAFFGAILFLWLNIYGRSPTIRLGGYTLAEIITYLVGSGLISSFILLTAQGDEIDDDINEGHLSNYLLKPLNVNFYWLTRDLARKFLTAMLGVIAFAAILVIGGKFLLPPASLPMLGLCLLAVAAGALLHFLLFYLTSVISFWFGRTWGFRFVFRVTMEIASGTIIPLSFLPGFWKNVFGLMPFKFIAYVPMQIYLGKMTAGEILINFGQGIIWLVLLAGLSGYLWTKGLSKYTASGA